MEDFHHDLLSLLLRVLLLLLLLLLLVVVVGGHSLLMDRAGGFTPQMAVRKWPSPPAAARPSLKCRWK